MNAPIIPVAIWAKIALEIADAQKIFQEALPDYKIKRNSWQKLDQCIINCDQTNKRSCIHSGIIINGPLFIGIDKFDDWLSALAMRGINV